MITIIGKNGTDGAAAAVQVAQVVPVVQAVQVVAAAVAAAAVIGGIVGERDGIMDGVKIIIIVIIMDTVEMDMAGAEDK